MVLRFSNILTVKGGSPELRQECLNDLLDIDHGEFKRLPGNDDTLKLSIDTIWSPLDSPLLDLAAEYLALDFVVEFNTVNPKQEQWKGVITLVDQQLFSRTLLMSQLASTQVVV